MPGSPAPGTVGTSRALTAAFAAILSPITRIASLEGPMNTTPARSHAAANRGFSARNP